jgi:hypothetical protein
MAGCLGQSRSAEDADAVARAVVAAAQAIDGSAKVIIAAIDQVLHETSSHG